MHTTRLEAARSRGRNRTALRVASSQLGVLALFAGLLVPSAHSPASASGCPGAVAYDESTDPILIDSEEHLLHLAATPADWGKDFAQTGNIDLTGCAWTPIGSGPPFTGSYDGRHFTITGLTITAGSLVGMFSEISGTGSVRNVRLVDALITASGANYLGAIAGSLSGGAGSHPTIENSSATGIVTGRWWVGGLVGKSDFGLIKNSFAAVAVTGEEYVGGLVGHDYGGSGGGIENSFASGSVTGTQDVGGLVGLLEGLSGANRNSVTNSYASGSVAGATRVGGLVGQNVLSFSLVTNAFWDTATTGQLSSAGGTGRATTDMKNFERFGPAPGADWKIVAGWDEFDPVEDQVWGICPALNDGYPFLLWAYTEDEVPVECGGTLAISEPGDDGDEGDEGDEGEGGEDEQNGDAGDVRDDAEAADDEAAGDVRDDAEAADDDGPVVRSPVLTGGMAPSVPAGAGVRQLADGTQVPLQVSSPEPGQVRYEADGVRVTFTGAPGTDASVGLIADPNGEVACEVCVELPAELPLDVWLFSTPRLLGTHTTLDLPCQTFTVSMVEPADGAGAVEAGAHTLQLAFPSADGPQAVNVGVTVGGPVPTVVPSGEGPAVPAGLLAFGLLVAAGAALAVRREAVGGVQAG